MENEEWKDIPGFYYQASTFGNIRHNVNKIPLKGRIDRYGYRYHTISIDGGLQKSMKEHRLVAYAFHGVSDLQIDHDDDNKLNNRPSNLKYCTPMYNCQKRSKKKFGTPTNINWHKKKKAFQVRVTKGGVRIHLGTFKTFEEAQLKQLQYV